MIAPFEHFGHVIYKSSIPRGQILVESCVALEHFAHVGDPRYIPCQHVLIKNVCPKKVRKVELDFSQSQVSSLALYLCSVFSNFLSVYVIKRQN